MNRPEIEEFVKGHSQAVLATIRKDGRPQLSSVLAAYDDGDFLVSTSTRTAKYRNLARDPRLTLQLLGSNFWQYVVLEGTASFTHLPDARMPLRHYYEIASGKDHPDWDEYDRAMEAERRVLVTISIDRIVSAYGIGG